MSSGEGVVVAFKGWTFQAREASERTKSTFALEKQVA